MPTFHTKRHLDGARPAYQTHALGRRLFARSIAAVLLILGATLAFEIYASSDRRISDARLELVRRIEIIKPSILQALWRIDPETVRVAVETIGISPGVQSASIKAQFRINDIDERYVHPDGDGEKCPELIVRDYADETYHDIRIGSGVLKVCFAPSLVPQDGLKALGWQPLLSILCVAILVAAALFWIVQRSVISPINWITERIRSRRLTSGATLPRDPIDRGDELDVLYTELAKAERRVEARHVDDKLRTLGVLAQGVAHDTNNMLAVALGNAEMWRKQAAGSSSGSEAPVDTVISAIKSASAVVGRLTLLGSPAIGAKRLVQVDTLVANITSFASTLIKSNISFVVTNHSHGTLFLDPGGLQAAFVNLLLNAMEELSGKPDGKILFSARDVVTKAAHEVHFEISDNGGGISEELLEHVRKPFFTTKENGNGLGLSIVDNYVSNIDGRFEIETGPGRGTVMRIILPAVATPQKIPVQAPSSKTDALHVLIVDDNAGYASLLAMQVSQLGHIAKKSSNPDALLVKPDEIRKYDVIIADVMLNQTTGPEFIAQLKKSLGDECPPVVFISGAGEQALAKLGPRDAATHFLQKPFDLGSLDALIRIAVAKPA